MYAVPCIVSQSLLADVSGSVRLTIAGSCGITNDIRRFKGKYMVVRDHTCKFIPFPIQVDSIYIQGKAMDCCELISNAAEPFVTVKYVEIYRNASYLLVLCYFF